MTSRRVLADDDSAYDDVIIPTAGRLLLVHHHQNVKVEWATFIASLLCVTAIYRLTLALSANGNKIATVSFYSKIATVSGFQGFKPLHQM